MSQTIRYLVTTDATTGAILKVERVGDAGELTEVPAGTLAGGAGHICQPNVVLNIHVHGQGAAITSGAGLGATSGIAPGPGIGPGPTAGIAPGPGIGPGPTAGIAPGPGIGPGPTSGAAPGGKPEKK